MFIIAFCGDKGSGKSTAADYLVSKGYTLVTFGDSLKDLLSVMFNWDRTLLSGDTPESRAWRETTDQFWSEQLDDPLLTPRKMLQFIGTDIIRNQVHSNFWVIKAKQKIDKLISDGVRKIVISDLRFKDEFDYVMTLNPIIIRINRISNEIKSKHISETEHLTFDAINVTNNESLFNLYKSVDKYLDI